MLKIGEKYSFEDNLSNRQSCLMFFKEDNSASWSVDIGFKEGNFGDERVSPAICINPIDTDKNSVEGLVGEKFSVTTVEECDDREDIFYIYDIDQKGVFFQASIIVDDDYKIISIALGMCDLPQRLCFLYL